MSFCLLFAIIHNSLKNSCVGCHDSWFENNFYIMVLMRRNLYLFWLNFEGKLLYCVGCFFADIKFNIASDFVTILNFNFLYYSLWNFGGNKGTKIKYPLFDKKDVRFYQTSNARWMMLAWHYQLLFKNRLKVFGINSRNARLSY